jgi:spoIIIJ-associated protein
MEWVETTGRTLEEAKEVALDQLGVDEQDAEFEVLEEAKSGLFGRLRTEARVRARVRPTTPPPKGDRRERRRRGPKSADEAVGATTVVESEPNEAVAERPAPRPSRSAAAPAGNRRAPSRPASDSPARGATMHEPVDIETTSDGLKSFLEGVVEAFGLVATVSVKEIDEGILEASIEGDELGLLVGPKGQTVDALQDLARSAVPHDGGTRLRVDVAGYRERRREALSRFATGIAEGVLSSGEATSLEPMSAADRKVVHDVISEIDGVDTTSEGEEPRRRVVVLPV